MRYIRPPPPCLSLTTFTLTLCPPPNDHFRRSWKMMPFSAMQVWNGRPSQRTRCGSEEGATLSGFLRRSRWPRLDKDWAIKVPSNEWKVSISLSVTGSSRGSASHNLITRSPLKGKDSWRGRSQNHAASWWQYYRYTILSESISFRLHKFIYSRINTT